MEKSKRLAVAMEATAQAKALIEIFRNAETKGLEPEDYDASRWASRLAALGRAKESAPQDALAEFDVALTVSVLRYVTDLHLGRVKIGRAHV